MPSHRAATPAPLPPSTLHRPGEPHNVVWDGQVATAPDGQLVGRWACTGCDYLEPRIIPVADTADLHR